MLHPAVITGVVDNPPICPAAVAAATLRQAAIDQVLRLVDDESQRLTSRLCHVAAVPPSLEQLRAGPLGQDLQRLALVADGRISEPPERVFAAIDSVVQLVFWPAGADDYAVPRSFWETDVGLLLARAKYQAVAAKDRVGIGAAARELGVSRPTVYRWIDDRSLDAVRDDRTGRTYVLRLGIVRRQLMLEEAMASA